MHRKKFKKIVRQIKFTSENIGSSLMYRERFRKKNMVGREILLQRKRKFSCVFGKVHPLCE